ncbi:MAG: Ni/Fe hydrogenase subunit alpha [Hadesarchaea archaeon]|nr:Ni/Fe hydrogenase subunit alpha [Hadesarchaea archaeon]
MTEIKLVERVEGHVEVDFEIDAKGDKKAKFSIAEGPRLFESFLRDRKYDEVPFFASRICGFCPIVHNLSAIKALENAMSIEPTEQVTKFRRALNLMEFIQSHSAHLYVLTLPDFVNKSGDIFNLSSKLPEEVKKAVKLRKDVNSLIEDLGGRAVHPLTTRVGGFSKIPSDSQIEKGISKLEEMMPIAEETVDLIASLDMPNFDASTNYLALGRNDDRYATYDGFVHSTDGLEFEVNEYSKIIQEETKSYSTAKFSTIEDKPYLTGALSRINLNGDNLSENAKRKISEANVEFPNHNPYYNNLAQAIEIVHSIDEIIEIYSNLLTEDLSEVELLGKELKENGIEIKAGKGTDAVEAPRGTLFHYYEVNENGIVKDADILTPTAQSAANIERDINLMISQSSDLPKEELEEKIKVLVRAYDPCISCSVH